MVNCNPETVSTDYDTADRLYFEPLTLESVLSIVEKERSAGAEVGCLVQFGGQTPLKLALALEREPVSAILGTSADAIDLAEDRERFSALLDGLGDPPARERHGLVAAPTRSRWPPRSASPWWCARPTCSAAAAWPSSTTGTALSAYMAGAVAISPEHPVLIDRFLEDAFELDVDALVDATGARRHRRHHGAHRGGRASTPATARAWCRRS